MILQLIERLAVIWHILSLLCLCEFFTLCMFCRCSQQERQPFYGSLQDFIILLWSTAPEKGIFWRCEQHQMKVEPDFLRLRIFYIQKRVRFSLEFNSKQGSEYFVPHSSAMPLVGIHSSWTFSNFRILLNILTIFYTKKAMYFMTIW